MWRRKTSARRIRATGTCRSTEVANAAMPSPALLEPALSYASLWTWRGTVAQGHPIKSSAVERDAVVLVERRNTNSAALMTRTLIRRWTVSTGLALTVNRDRANACEATPVALRLAPASESSTGVVGSAEVIGMRARIARPGQSSRGWRRTELRRHRCWRDCIGVTETLCGVADWKLQRTTERLTVNRVPCRTTEVLMPTGREPRRAAPWAALRLVHWTRQQCGSLLGTSDHGWGL